MYKPSVFYDVLKPTIGVIHTYGCFAGDYLCWCHKMLLFTSYGTIQCNMIGKIRGHLAFAVKDAGQWHNQGGGGGGGGN